MSPHGQVVHLHNHSEHSCLDGLSRLRGMCQIAAEQGQDAIALTDHGTLGGAWKFAKAAKEVGIKPIQGCELYLSLGAREERNEEIEPRDDEGDTDADDDSHGKTTGGGDTKTRRYQHLTVLAASTQGWDSLVRIQSAAHSSFWYKPRADFDLLARHSDGLIVLTGCLGGPVANKLKRGDYEGARANLGRLIEAVGKDNVYVEVMDHGIAVERKVTGGLVDLAREFWGPADYEKRVVATNDAHYPRDTDAAAHDAWLAVGVNRKMADTNRFAFKGTGYFIRSAEQMRSIFDDGNGTTKAVDTTLDIAQRCSSDVLPDSHLRLPQFPTPQGFTGNAAAYLKQQVRAGAHRRYGSPLPQPVRDRLNFEFTIISEMGLADYFLIVADIIDASRKHGVRVGPGRGSSAGAVVSYCLEIVNVDPLAHGLLFERFLDPARVGMPDVDIDFDTVGRDWAINYAVNKYGADRVARIGTFGMARSRQAIKNAARVLDYAPIGNELSKLVPIVGDGKPMDFDQLDDEGNGASTAFRAKVAASEEAKSVIELARSFEGVVSQEGIHACGVVIADAPFDGLVPLRWDHRKGAEGDTAVTAWDGKDMDDAQFLKLDFLGLRNLDVISEVVRLIEATTGEVVDADNPPTDPTDERVRATWAGIRAGRTAGLFQLDGAGMTKLCEQIAPESVADLSAIIALYRPGPLGAKMDVHYVARKRGEQDVDYGIYTADPAEQAVIASVLDDTYGVAIYQESLMILGELVAGFGSAEKNRLRRAFSKKKRPEIEAMKVVFIDGAQAEVIDERGVVTKMAFAVSTAEKLWETFDASAEYIFNKCLTGDTLVPTGGAKVWELGELYRKLSTIDTPGPVCGWCAKVPSAVRGLCRGCYAWHQKFHHPAKGLTLLSYDSADGRIRPKRVKDVHHNGVRDVWRVDTADGKSVRATAEHRFRTPRGWTRVRNLTVGDQLLVHGGYEPEKFTEYRTTVGDRRTGGSVYATGPDNAGYVDGGFVKLTEWTQATIVDACCAECGVQGVRLERAHLNGDRTCNEPENLRWFCVSHHKRYDYLHNARRRRFGRGHAIAESAIVSITADGRADTYDVEMDDVGHNFVANGIVSHNSHSVAYGQTAYITAYLKANWPSQYGAALLAVTAQDDKRQGTLNALRAEGITVTPPSLRLGGVSTTTDPDGSVRLGMREIKGVGDAARWIVAERDENGPFESVRDLLRRVKVPATPGGPLVQNLGIGAVDGLVEAGALDEYGSRLGMKMALRAERDSDNVAVPDMEWGSLERSARERDRLGLALSTHPLMALKDQIREWRPPGMHGKTRPMSDIPVAIQNIGTVDGAEILTLGVLASWAERSYSRGRMARITLEGSTSSVDGVLWDETLLALKTGGDLPVVGSIVALRGKVTVTTVDTGDDGGSEERREVTVWQMWKVALDDDARVGMPASSSQVPLRRLTATGATAPAPITSPTADTSPPPVVPTEPTDTLRSSPAAAETPEPVDPEPVNTGREVVRCSLLLDKTYDAAAQLSSTEWERVHELLFPTYPWRQLESRVAETPGGTDLEVFTTPDGRSELVITVYDGPVPGDNVIITAAP